MNAENLEAQVIELAAQMGEVAPERVALTARLLHDLGIDGDDAVELFDGVHERFGTDLTHLYEEWSEHFGPEGMPLSARLAIIPAGVAGGVVFSLLNAPVGDVGAGIAAVSGGGSGGCGVDLDRTESRVHQRRDTNHGWRSCPGG